MSTLTIHDISQAIYDEVIEEFMELAQRYNLPVAIDKTSAMVGLPEIHT